MTLVVVITEAEAPKVWGALGSVSRDDAFTSNRLLVLAEADQGFYLLPSNDPLRGWFEVPDGATILISKAVRRAPVQALQRRCIVQNTISTQEWFVARRDRRLEPLLRQHSLHWRCQADETFALYERRRSDFSVEAWIKQFERLGDRKVGEALARMLRVFDTSRLVEACAPARLLAATQPRIFGVGSRLGKSGARISALLRNFARAEILEVGRAIEVHATNKVREPLHVFEDGLWTGIELKRMVDSLRGISSKPKVEPLKNPAWLDEIDIHMHYLVQTDLGQRAAACMLREAGLTRVHIVQDASTVVLPVLNPVALARFERGEYTFRHVEDHLLPVGEMIPGVHSFQAAWWNAALMDRVARFLQTMPPLYTSEMDDHPGPTQSLPFGANHIGSLYVFSHSSPRAALPVYWRDGVIKTSQGEHRWVALVPEEHYLETP